MPSSRDERLYLQDIVEAVDAVARFVAELERETFAGNDLVRSAVLHKLQVIGEAAAHLGEETRRASPQVPWVAVVGFRNYTVHAYFAVDWDIVWTTATVDAPTIGDAVRALLVTMPVPG
ncbi:MAG: DUF86 domain-containing protein [Deltaproteobacteria bacterium]|nr:DUF86 domain-containing protein [Deltaproteobacteria bacterium]